MLHILKNEMWILTIKKHSSLCVCVCVSKCTYTHALSNSKACSEGIYPFKSTFFSKCIMVYPEKFGSWNPCHMQWWNEERTETQTHRRKLWLSSVLWPLP